MATGFHSRGASLPLPNTRRTRERVVTPPPVQEKVVQKVQENGAMSRGKFAAVLSGAAAGTLAAAGGIAAIATGGSKEVDVKEPTPIVRGLDGNEASAFSGPIITPEKQPVVENSDTTFVAANADNSRSTPAVPEDLIAARVLREPNIRPIEFTSGKDIEALMEENPLLRDPEAVEIYLDYWNTKMANDAWQSDENIESKYGYEEAWPEYVQSTVEETSGYTRTKYMLLRSPQMKHPVTGEDVYHYVSIGRHLLLEGDDFEGLRYAKSSGYARTMKEAESIDEAFRTYVVDKLE